MIQEITQPEIFTLTPKKAEKFINMDSLEAERKVRPRLLNIYANKIREDLFHPPTIATAELNYNGNQAIRINGQHVCHAVIQSNKPIRALRLRFSCDTPEDASMLYRQFDQGYGNRSLQNFTQIEAKHALKLEWPPRICSLVVSASGKKSGKTNLTKEEKVALLSQNLDQGAFVNFILNKSLPEGTAQRETAHLRKGCLVAVMMVTWEKCHQVAEDFWMRVRDGEGLAKTDPSKLLRDFLIMSSLTIGRGLKYSERKSVTEHEMQFRAMVAWNAFRRKKKLRILKYYPNKPVPKPV